MKEGGSISELEQFGFVNPVISGRRHLDAVMIAIKPEISELQ